MKKFDHLDVIIPISIELDWPTCDSIVEEVLEQNREFGFTRFALSGPCGGWRSVGYPPREHYVDRAKLYVQVRDRLKEHGISCGWWNTLTVKSGASDKFITMVKENGTSAPFGNCPLDPGFRQQFAEDIAIFADIARPDFIFFEDDYSVGASAGRNGCFCHHHLEEFARRQGRAYTREELSEIFASQTPEAFQLLRQWRELTKDSLVGLSEAIRREVDKKTPEIPIGLMQSGSVDRDGDCTEAVSRALAGPNHTPFCRIQGTFYNGGDTEEIPKALIHCLYTRQHIAQPFRYYHESDTYPHTRYFASAGQMRAIMSMAYSYGFDGSTHQTQQLIDDANEEKVYGKMFARERGRYNEMSRVSGQCRLKGLELCYDPFWNTVDTDKKADPDPYWTRCVSLFGLPYTTEEAPVAFWDERQAKYWDHETVLRYLSKGLILDGAAAKALYERGYGKYIGVAVGENVAKGMVGFDLGAREVILPPFDKFSKGKNMPSAHMFAPSGKGNLLQMTVTDPKCEVITEEVTFQKQFISTAMTRFENELGGRVVVMGITVKGNRSQSLMNYRRRNLLQEMLLWCGADVVMVKDAPMVVPIVGEAVDAEKSGFFGMVTLLNLCDDTPEELTLHLSKAWAERTEFSLLEQDGTWRELKCEKEGNILRVLEEIRYCEPMCILAK